MSLRAALYCRLSYAPDGSVEKVERQEADSRAAAERLGWSVDGVYCDNNKSAWDRGVVRDEWERMLVDIRAGRYDAIITYHGDRLMRQPHDLETLLRIADERQLQLASVSGTRDLSSPDDRFVLRIEVAQACRESDNTSRRARRGTQARAAAGLPQPGRYRGYGYSRDGMTVIPVEAEVIRDMAKRVLAGQSVRSIAARLNAERVPTVTGVAWIPATVRCILGHPRIAGLRAMRGKVVGPGSWEPILDRDEWEAVQALVTPPRRPSRPHPGRRHLLTGIALCGSCGMPLIAHKRADGKSYSYYCDKAECPGPRVCRATHHLDAYVSGYVVDLLNDPELRLGTEPDPKLARELAAVQAGKDKLLAEIADDPVMAADVLRVTVPRINERIESLRGRIAEQHATHALDDLVGIDRDRWDRLPLERKREVVARLVRVTVYPSTKRGRSGFDSSTVALERLI